MSRPSLSVTPQVAGDASQDPRQWRALFLLNLYRLFLALLAVILELGDLGPQFLGESKPLLYRTTALIYVSMALIGNLAVYTRRPNFVDQVYIQVMTDIVAIVLLMHASGGVASGLGMLLVPAIAGGALLMAGRMAILFAAMASIGVLTEQVYTHLFRADVFTYYTQTGILGATFFATAILAYVLAQRVRESEALAEQRGIDLANLEQLNEFIIQRMQSGIVVVDHQLRIRMMNQAAWYLLGRPEQRLGIELSRVSSELSDQVAAARNDPDYQPEFCHAESVNSEFLPRFAELSHDGNHRGTIVFLEDRALLEQQVQQMKLASLGRLTASIAHEIRNPLGAISHAGQLLGESHANTGSDNRMLQIIQDNSERVNSIIENVLQISRRKPSRPETADLGAWLNAFRAEFIADQNISSERILVTTEPEMINIHIDLLQLHQVVFNLCQNIVHHGDGSAIELRGGLSAESGRPYLSVIDHGPTIPTDTVRQLFEPFFTTRPKGTGLGLYIARELCLLNQAQLNYYPVDSGGNCFTIAFDDPNREMRPT